MKTLPRFSRMSLRASALRPGRQLLSSEACGWTSILLQTFEQPGTVEQYEAVASPDALVVVVLKGAYEIESFSSGSWKKASYRPGVGGLTAPGTTNRLRWSSKSNTESIILRLYIPAYYFDESREEYRRAGERTSSNGLDALSFTDPLIVNVVRSLGQQIGQGAPDLLADAGARFLATYLLSKMNRRPEQRVSRSERIDLTDRRLLRVMEYMQQHCTDQLTSVQLAAEAGISPFHFSRLFKEKLGITPHRYLTRLRMQLARNLLKETGMSIGEIACTCGYMHHGHFAAAFANEYKCSPTEFRTQHLI